MTNEVRQTLLGAAALVRKGWTQRCNARDAEGKETSAYAPRARCWCAFGAIWRSAPYISIANDVVAECEMRLGLSCSLTQWNDAGRGYRVS